MKKILIISEGSNFPKTAFEFACEINKKELVLLTGVFFPQIDYSTVWNYGPGIRGSALYPIIDRDLEKNTQDKNIQHFEECCIRNDIEFRVHKDFHDFYLPEFKKETRFADLAIISEETFKFNGNMQEEDDYLGELLSISECPILILPKKFDSLCLNVLAYDGSSTSMYAIKQFANLFPELSKNETLLVYTSEGNSKTLPDEKLMEEFVTRHFPNLTVCSLQNSPRKDFTSWIESKPGAIIITGAFGRSAFSRLFKKSFITQILIDNKLPVFI
jgi:hypothetical protein